MGVVDDLLRGREAFERREWAAARDHLATQGLDDLGAEDLEALATATFLVGDRDGSVQAWQRAFRERSGAGETVASVRDAFWIALVTSLAGDAAVGSGWAARARRLLEAEPGGPDGFAESGLLALFEMHQQLFAGDFAEAVRLAGQVTAAGRRFRDADLLAQGLCSEGRLAIYSGQVAAGLAMLDEAMVGVVAGEVSPIFAGMIYCTMIEGCQEVGDVRRMTAWTSALTRWCDEQPGLVPFTGQCAVHRAQIMRVQGAFGEALDELELARSRYEANGLDPAVGLAHYERGQVLRLRGDYDAAARAYDEAATAGHEPQPGLALLWLVKGRTSAALAAIRRRLEEAADPVHRSQVLPAAVEVLLGCDQPVDARVAADELTRIADGFQCAALTAEAAYAEGAVALAESDAAGALSHLRRAWRAWLDVGARHEAARTRIRIGQAFRALGDEDSAVSELTVARRTFAELGAGPGEREAQGLLGAEFPDGLTGREVEVLRLVAAGRTNPQIAATLFLSEKTVARHLSNIFTKIGVSSRTAAAAYAFNHDLS